MLRIVVSFVLGVCTVFVGFYLLAGLQPGDRARRAAMSFFAEPGVDTNDFIKIDTPVSLPEASEPRLDLPTERLDISPARTQGIYRGRWLGAEDRSLFQQDGRAEVWTLAGDALPELWSIWNEHQKLAYEPDRAGSDGAGPPSEDRFWPYVCLEIEVAGVLEIARVEPLPPHDILYANTLFSADVLGLRPDDCVRE